MSRKPRQKKRSGNGRVTPRSVTVTAADIDPAELGTLNRAARRAIASGRVRVSPDMLAAAQVGDSDLATPGTSTTRPPERASGDTARREAPTANTGHANSTGTATKRDAAAPARFSAAAARRPLAPIVAVAALLMLAGAGVSVLMDSWGPLFSALAILSGPAVLAVAAKKGDTAMASNPKLAAVPIVVGLVGAGVARDPGMIAALVGAAVGVVVVKSVRQVVEPLPALTANHAKALTTSGAVITNLPDQSGGSLATFAAHGTSLLVTSLDLTGRADDDLDVAADAELQGLVTRIERVVSAVGVGDMSAAVVVEGAGKVGPTKVAPGVWVCSPSRVGTLTRKLKLA